MTPLDIFLEGILKSIKILPQWSSENKIVSKEEVLEVNMTVLKIEINSLLIIVHISPF